MVGLKLIMRLKCGFGLTRNGVFGVDDERDLNCVNIGERSVGWFKNDFDYSIRTTKNH